MADGADELLACFVYWAIRQHIALWGWVFNAKRLHFLQSSPRVVFNISSRSHADTGPRPFTSSSIQSSVIGVIIFSIQAILALPAYHIIINHNNPKSQAKQAHQIPIKYPSQYNLSPFQNTQSKIKSQKSKSQTKTCHKSSNFAQFCKNRHVNFDKIL